MEKDEVDLEGWMKFLCESVDTMEEKKEGKGDKWGKEILSTLLNNIQGITRAETEEEGGAAAMFKKYAKDAESHGRSKDVQHDEDGDEISQDVHRRSRRSSFAEEGRAEELT